MSKFLIALFLATAGAAQAQQVLAEKPVPLADTSPPLRVMAAQAPPQTAGRQVFPYLRVTPQMRTPVVPDVLRNRAAEPYSGLISWPAQPPLPSVLTNGTPINEEGIPANNGAPSDANGAVGSSQYVQWVNTQFSIYNKASGALILGPLNGDVLWAGLTGSSGADACRTTNRGDPIAQYDQLANRWVLTQFAFIDPIAGPFFQCIAVSATDDATGSYFRYVLNNTNTSGTSLLGDYPKMGVWPDAYYFTFVLFTNANGGYQGPRACGLDRGPMLTGGGTTARCFDFGTSFGPVLPSDIDGRTLPPPNSPNYLMSLDFGNDASGDHLFLWRFSFTGNSISSTLTVPVAPFTIACPTLFGGHCIPQPPPGEPLDALADRLMYRLVYHNYGDREALFVNHSVQQPGAPLNGPVGVRWYEIRNPASGTVVYQQGTWAPDGNSRWMASIGTDRMGNIALGYSISSPTVFPGIRYTGRLRTEPLGRLEPEATIVNGGGAQVDTFNRWGDYSGMETDASDECTFWYTNQYIGSTGSFNWQSRIANFKFRNCTGSPPALRDAGN